MKSCGENASKNIDVSVLSCLPGPKVPLGGEIFFPALYIRCPACQRYLFEPPPGGRHKLSKEHERIEQKHYEILYHYGAMLYLWSMIDWTAAPIQKAYLAIDVWDTIRKDPTRLSEYNADRFISKPLWKLSMYEAACLPLEKQTEVLEESIVTIVEMVIRINETNSPRLVRKLRALSMKLIGSFRMLVGYNLAFFDPFNIIHDLIEKGKGESRPYFDLTSISDELTLFISKAVKNNRAFSRGKFPRIQKRKHRKPALECPCMQADNIPSTSASRQVFSARTDAIVKPERIPLYDWRVRLRAVNMETSKPRPDVQRDSVNAINAFAQRLA